MQFHNYKHGRISEGLFASSLANHRETERGVSWLVFLKCPEDITFIMKRIRKDWRTVTVVKTTDRNTVDNCLPWKQDMRPDIGISCLTMQTRHECPRFRKNAYLVVKWVNT